MESLVYLLLFGPYLFFAIGFVNGIFARRQKSGSGSKVVAMFSVPISLLAILFLSFSLIPGKSGPNMLGLSYIFAAPVFLLLSPLIVHAGWFIGKSMRLNIS
ncbi:hypothetical protein K1718_10395 [Roseibium porphyridii]|uniref:Transmembrane protein n=1 Tax=Roseibium porphyridii TaxID=2866279 RepID=A0ABY8FAH3_9HYPH|nr:hypothetical protein [Roseibium sp. KMA01]WFE91744.1 hypothetical protein K1718_10395 [Roseibium sp. KMA01]